MRKILVAYQSFFGTIHFVTFILLIMSLAFPWAFTQPLFAIWLIAWALEGRWTNLRHLQWSKALIPVMMLCGFVAWEALSLLWTQDPSSGKSELERHLPILAIALVALFGANEQYKSYRLKTALMVGSLVSVVAYCTVCYQYASMGLLWDNPHRWTCSAWAILGEGPVGIIKHRSHYCIVLLMSLGFSIDLYRYYRTRFSALSAGLTIGIADAILIAAVVLTGSRTGIILLPIVGTAMLLMNYHGRGRKAMLFVIIGAYLALVAVGVTYNNRLISVKEDLNKLMKEEQTIEHIDEPRLAIYHCALRHWDEYGLWGVGFGASQQKMQELYEQDHMKRYVRDGYGTHNRYLKTWIEMGPLALLWMLFILFSAPFWHTGQARHDAVIMCLAFGGSMMTENVLTMIGALYIFFTMVAFIQIEQREADSLPPAHP